MSTTAKKGGGPGIRLDCFIVEQGLVESREKAKSSVLSGWVKVNGETVRDPSKKIAGTARIEFERPGGVYVSRGGEKLARALEFFHISLKDAVVLDLGASTGGFTDCMLRNGAVKVYAVDVGYNQIDYRLRTDSRVIVMEKTNAKEIRREIFPGTVDFFTADLSFISILKVLPVVYKTFEEIEGVVLIKPQFEAEPGQHKKGVVRDPVHHREILERTVSGIRVTGFCVAGLTYSPVKGPAGNIEFLAYLKKAGPSSGTVPGHEYVIDIAGVVEESHNVLNNISV